MEEHGDAAPSPGMASSVQRARRGARACDLCRRRKERCDGHQPRCTTCSTSGRECNYRAKPKKRGLREGWVHSLEKLWGMVLLCRPDVEQMLISALNDGIRDAPVNDFAAQWGDEFHEQALLKRWRSSSLAQHLAHILPTLETLPRQKLADTTGNPEVLPALMTHMESDPFPSLSSQFTMPLPDAFMVPYGEEPSSNNNDIIGHSDDIANDSHANDYSNTAPPEEPVTHANKPSLPPDSVQMLNTYFARTQNWLPILEKHHVYHTFYRCEKDSSLLKSTAAAPLLAILHYECSLRHQCQAFQGESTSQVNHNDLFDQAKNLIPQDGQDVELDHAQALLILSLSCVQRGLLVGAVMMVAQAARIGFVIRAVRKDAKGIANDNRLPHILRACYCLDGVLSSRLRIPLSFPPSACGDTCDISEDGDEEWVPTSFSPYGPLLSLSIFNQFSHAMQDMTTALRACDTHPDCNEATLVSLLDHTEAVILFDAPQMRSSSVLFVTPQKLTTQLLHHLTLFVLVSSTHLRGLHDTISPEKATRLAGTTRDFCGFFKSFVVSMDRNSILPIWQPLWVIMFEHLTRHQWPYASIELTAALLASIQAVISSLANSNTSLGLASHEIQPDDDLISQLSREEGGSGGAAPVAGAASSGPLPIIPMDLDVVLTSQSTVLLPDSQNIPRNSLAASERDQAHAPGLLEYSSLRLSEPEILTRPANINSATDSTRPTSEPAQEMQQDPGRSPRGRVSSDVSSTAFDFMTMDAINFYDSCGQSLQNLGFAGEEDPEDLNSFFINSSDDIV